MRASLAGADVKVAKQSDKDAGLKAMLRIGERTRGMWSTLLSSEEQKAEAALALLLIRDRLSQRDQIPSNVKLMSVGSEVRFWIPEALAYQGRRGRPAGMLVFDVELLEFK